MRFFITFLIATFAILMILKNDKIKQANTDLIIEVETLEYELDQCKFLYKKGK